MIDVNRAARVGLALCAVAVVVLALTRGHDVRSCTDARRDAFAVANEPGRDPLLDEGRGSPGV